MTLSYFILDSAIILEVEGKDSARYLNSRLTNDIKLLLVGQNILAAALSPHGRTQALFTVSCLAQNHYLLSCDGGSKDAVVAALKKYIVADRVEVRDLSDQRLVHAAGELAGSPIDQLLEKSSHIRIAKDRGFANGLDLVIGAKDCQALVDQLSKLGAKQIARQTQTARRIASKIPSFPEEINEQTIFAEAGLTQAVSFKKGCYVGQEVVEKIESRGRTPHTLQAFRSASSTELAPGQKILASNDQTAKRIEIGEVVNSATDLETGVTYFFGAVKNQDLSQIIGFEVNGVGASLI